MLVNMDEKISILLVDDNVEFAGILCEFLSKFDEFDMLGIASDGVKAIDETSSFSQRLGRFFNRFFNSN